MEDENPDTPKSGEPFSRALEPDERALIEAVLGYTFSDPEWLERALTHRSAPQPSNQSSSRSDYERLEFLGDAVFDLATAHLLSDAFPQAREGELSKMRAALVNTQSLASIARKISLGTHIRLGRGELSSGGDDRPSILADVLEAVLGAIYRDSGYEQAYDCIKSLFGESIKEVTPRDPKTELQEALHARGTEAPNYLLECVEGPEHAPTFVSIVEIAGEILGRGKGSTKKASQQMAAAQALEKLNARQLNDKEDNIPVQTGVEQGDENAH